MKRSNLDLYHIDSDYIKHLQKFDNHVQNNYENAINKKPYVGVVLSINDRFFFAPLTSPKEKHLRLRDSDPTTFKIKHNGKFLGSILLNNMIPVKQSNVTKIKIEGIEEPYYKGLLRKDYQVIVNNQDTIKHKASILYKSVVNKESKYFTKVSCDFLKLEKACDSYQTKEANTSTALSEQQKSLNKSYKIEFVYNKEDKTRYSYNVLVNNVQASEAIKQNPEIEKVLDHVASHKDLVAKGITAEQLKSGVIYPQKLDNEIKVTRPENRTVDNQGNKIELTKAKASQLEL